MLTLLNGCLTGVKQAQACVLSTGPIATSVKHVD